MDKFLEYFYDIASIPHGSGNTKKISDYLKCFAIDHGLYYRQDESNNIIIIKDAYPGYESHEPVILQGHMDMVTVKEDSVSIDMKEEGLSLLIENDVLSAKGTSLGGDDGIAVAYILTLLDGDFKAPRIEAVITVDEEIGMLGAKALQVSDLTAKRMINIDQEEEGIFVIGCAGGARVDIKIPVNKEILAGNIYTVRVSGLKGGHSGIDINKNRMNGIKLLSEELCKLHDSVPFRLIEINGGVADNAIPNDVSAKIMLTDEMLNSVFENKILSLNGMDFYSGDAVNYDKADFFVKKEKYDEMIVLSDADTINALKLIAEVPYGVMAMDERIEDMVLTSLNSGIIKSNEENIDLSISVRSNVNSLRDELVYKLCKLAKDSNASYDVHGKYPGWEYAGATELEKVVVDTYEEMFLCKPRLESIHAGLECGIFAEKIDGLQCISIGPDIIDIHSVNEHLPLPSARRCFELIVNILKKL